MDKTALVAIVVGVLLTALTIWNIDADNRPKEPRDKNTEYTKKKKVVKKKPDTDRM
jgi:hypothetical protein